MTAPAPIVWFGRPTYCDCCDTRGAGCESALTPENVVVDGDENARSLASATSAEMYDASATRACVTVPVLTCTYAAPSGPGGHGTRTQLPSSRVTSSTDP